MAAGRGMDLRLTGTLVCSEKWLEAQRGIEIRAKNLVVLPKESMQFADDIMRAIVGDAPPIFADEEEESG